MKDKLGVKIMKKFVGLRAKSYIYLIDDDSEDKKAKNTKKFVINSKIIKTPQKQFNLQIKQTIQKKN